MAAKRGFNLAILLVIIILLSLFVFLQQTKESYTERKTPINPNEPELIRCQPYQRADCISAEGYKGFRVCENGILSKCYIASLDECSIKKDQLFVVCCKSKDGNLYSCDDKRDFSPGEYIIVKTNLQMAMSNLAINLESYKACGFSSLLTAESRVTEHFQKSSAFYDEQADVGCSTLFYSKDFHQGAVSGIVPATKGKTKLVEWRIYPSNLQLSNASEALSNIDSSSSVFAFEVNVGE